ncbi:MAG: hypothetical protein A2418_03400 [Candidatus Brennerbacteria bacterium RIFOXYC1_FULL_41_11]|nr:MAG: hypothetical protein A2418_03400 [Candidatus Brennerbacteria bacterium RIFOXYC1_FULL_41_11]
MINKKKQVRSRVAEGMIVKEARFLLYVHPGANLDDPRVAEQLGLLVLNNWRLSNNFCRFVITDDGKVLQDGP